LKDVDLSSGTAVVQRGKGGKRRVVGIDGGTTAVIRVWLDFRLRKGLADVPLLFCTLRGTPLDQSYVRHLLPRLARRAGITKRVHAHGFRHAYAIELEREGASITFIRDLLGHSSLAVTDQYLRRAGASEAVEFNRRRQWIPDDGF
jgi:integrase/recombinase XerC